MLNLLRFCCVPTIDSKLTLCTQLTNTDGADHSQWRKTVWRFSLCMNILNILNNFFRIAIPCVISFVIFKVFNTLLHVEMYDRKRFSSIQLFLVLRILPCSRISFVSGRHSMYSNVMYHIAERVAGICLPDTLIGRGIEI